MNPKLILTISQSVNLIYNYHAVFNFLVLIAISAYLNHNGLTYLHPFLAIGRHFNEMT